MNTPIFNIQEAAALYFALRSSGNMPQTVRTPLPYSAFLMTFWMEAAPNSSVLCASRVCDMGNGYAEINIWLCFKDKTVWASKTCFPCSTWAAYSEHVPPEYTPIMNNTFFNSKAKVWPQFAEDISIFAIHLMNCRNVGYVDYDPNKGIPWRNKSNGKKKPKPPFVKYKILQINPISPQTQEVNRPRADPSHAQRVHTVRGHFKTYTAERPLFGKLTGTFWWGDCVKGNPAFGLVEKDYQIKIPTALLEQLKTEGGGRIA